MLKHTCLSAAISLFSLMAGCFSSEAPLHTLTPSSAPTDSWTVVAPGLEQRIYVPPGNSLGTLVTLRIDANRFVFRVHYRPGAPLSTSEWQSNLPGAAAFVNANFFDPQHNALGLVVADAVAFGQAYTDRGALLQVQGGLVRVRPIVQEPYVGEALDQAIQGFPLLVSNGAQVSTRFQTDRATRRTVAAQDAQGRILLLATPLLGLSLSDLARYLVSTDLQIVHAVNLDGGRSTMMHIGIGTQPYMLTSFDPVPTVLAIYPRSS
jgi:hypothetical protein